MSFNETSESLSQSIATNYYDTSLTLNKSQKYSDALESINKALDLLPENEQYLILKSVILSKLNLREDQIIILNQILSKNKYNIEALVLKAFYYLESDKKENLEKSLSTFRQAFEIRSNDPTIICGLSQAMNGLEMFEESLTNIERAIEINNKFVFAYNLKGYALTGLKKYNNALEVYYTGLSIEKNNVIYNNIGYTLINMEKYHDALDAIDKGICIKPFPPLYCNKGNALIGINMFDEALEYFDKALDLKFDYKQALTGKAIALSKKGDYEKAKDYVEKALLIDCNFAKAVEFKRSLENKKYVYKE